MLTLTLEQLLAFAAGGTLVSLTLEYFPRLTVWFNNLEDNAQRGIVLASGLVVVLGAWGFDCASLLELPWACTSAGLVDAFAAYLVYIFSTQSTHSITPRRASS